MAPTLGSAPSASKSIFRSFTAPATLRWWPIDDRPVSPCKEENDESNESCSVRARGRAVPRGGGARPRRRRDRREYQGGRHRFAPSLDADRRADDGGCPGLGVWSG